VVDHVQERDEGVVVILVWGWEAERDGDGSGVDYEEGRQGEPDTPLTDDVRSARWKLDDQTISRGARHSPLSHAQRKTSVDSAA
jgi:hypothetical protein